jgi:1-phosphofructokinase
MAREASMTNHWEVDPPRLAVLAPSPIVTVTVERAGPTAAEIHFHPGGQGFWVARMAASLGVNVVLCAALGGESGRVARALLDEQRVELRSVSCRRPSGAYIHDRRSGERVELAAVPSPALNRHELDELFGVAVTAGLECGVLLLTGSSPQVVPPDFYGRLAADLRNNGCRVLADLTGPALEGALGGGLDVLKLSDEELLSAGRIRTRELSEICAAAEELVRTGADNVLVTRAAEGAIVLAGAELLEIRGPRFTALDPHGTGDSMFAALGAGLAGGLTLRQALRVAGAAGALNATRRGLGSGSRSEVERLAASVDIKQISPTGPSAGTVSS